MEIEFEPPDFFRHAGRMYFRSAVLVLCAIIVFGIGTGCNKSEVITSPALPTVLSPDTIASVHWLGKRRLGYEATAFFFMRIWNQAGQLERQTLTKLATTPGEWLPGGTNMTSEAVRPLWLLLNDLVQEESYLEIHDAPSFVFAIRLNETQADSWFTNLSQVLQPLTGNHAVINVPDHTWSLETTNGLNVIKLVRAGEWTIVSAGPRQNTFDGEMAARIRRDGVPFISAGTNLWLEASMDIKRLNKLFPPDFNDRSAQESNPLSPSYFLSSVSHLNISFTGDGANVITRGQLTFNQPFAVPLKTWQLPVELMHEPLTSFTAVRGLDSWLTGWKSWGDIKIDAPDQFFLWSLGGSPYQIYLAMPLPDARQSVTRLTDNLIQKANPWLAANGYISFDRAPESDGVIWGNLPDIKPFIKFAGTDDHGWLFAGLLPDTNNATLPPPAGLIQDVLRRTNLVYYDWEVTGPRLQPMLQLSQTVRQIGRQPEMAMDSVAINLLATLIPRLGTSATVINRTDPDQLTFYRRSTLGFNAAELHLIADWLESPRFPHGLHSTQ